MHLSLRLALVAPCFLLASLLANAQGDACTLCGTYYSKERGPNHCMKLNADGTFQRYLDCDKTTEVYEEGTWTIGVDIANHPAVVLSSDSPTLKECKKHPYECALIYKEGERKNTLW
ncbi:MAG: hypothetical protein IPJ76_14710 [Flavobacteriales bacterium]|nr:MAG: hypothetical protein IPJ76_14710 [Flavobacteriales bacterium]